MIEFLRGYELDFAIDILLALAAGFIIGAERESRGKAAGISTNCFVIGGSMIFIEVIYERARWNAIR